MSSIQDTTDAQPVIVHGIVVILAAAATPILIERGYHVSADDMQQVSLYAGSIITAALGIFHLARTWQKVTPVAKPNLPGLPTVDLSAVTASLGAHAAAAAAAIEVEAPALDVGQAPASVLAPAEPATAE